MAYETSSFYITSTKKNVWAYKYKINKSIYSVLEMWDFGGNVENVRFNIRTFCIVL